MSERPKFKAARYLGSVPSPDGGRDEIYTAPPGDFEAAEAEVVSHAVETGAFSVTRHEQRADGRVSKSTYFSSRNWNAKWQPTGPKPNWQEKADPTEPIN